jgi:putative transposase
LMMAISQRKPAKGLLWHSDRGSQYASESHRALLKTAWHPAEHESQR